MTQATPPTVCLSFDFDQMSSRIFRGDITPTPLSRGEYGARVGIWKVLDLLDRYGIPATFFVPAWTAETYPEQCKEIARRGHEVACHGHRHVPLGAEPPERAREGVRRLARAIHRLRSA